MIPVSKPSLSIHEINGIEKVFNTGWLGLGSVTKDFETNLRNYVNSKNIVATSTGTDALHLAIDSYRIGKGDEVIIPSMTYAAGVQAIISSGATPVFVECCEKNLLIDVNDVKNKLTEKTKAIMPVHYCGQSCDMDALLDIGESKKIKIIEDAAHAVGSKYKSKNIGSFGHATCFSFDPIKVITSGEGGAVSTNDDSLVSIMNKKRILGIDKETWSRYKNERKRFYDVVDKGYRYHMPNFCAAIGIEQLKKIDSFILKRKKICKDYDIAFSDLENIETLKVNYESTAPFIYILKIKNNLRSKFINHLKKAEIDTAIHYIPNHNHSYFKKFHRSALPITESVGKEIVTIPLFVDMKQDQIDHIIDTIIKFDEINTKKA